MRGHLWLYVCLLLSGATGAPLVCTECLNNGTLITSRPCACGCSDGWAPPRCAALLTGTSSLALSFAMPRSDFMSQSFSEAVRASTLQVSAKTTGVFTFSRLVGVTNVAEPVTSSTDSFAAIFTVANPFVQPLLLLESDAPTAVAARPSWYAEYHVTSIGYYDVALSRSFAAAHPALVGGTIGVLNQQAERSAIANIPVMWGQFAFALGTLSVLVAVLIVEKALLANTVAQVDRAAAEDVAGGSPKAVYGQGDEAELTELPTGT